jgi:hypothetical protein
MITRALGVSLAVPRADGYREQGATPLPGEWLGAFAQPGVLLAAVTAMRVELTADGGTTTDEYGAATLAPLRVDGDRVEWHKQYARGERFVYVGRLVDGVLAGYWYAPRLPSFGGVFWLGRADRLAAAAATELRARVRSTSWRRRLLKLLFLAATIALAIGIRVAPLVAAAIAVIAVGFVILHRRRMRAMGGERDRWQRVLGDPRT